MFEFPHAQYYLVLTGIVLQFDKISNQFQYA